MSEDIVKELELVPEKGRITSPPSGEVIATAPLKVSRSGQYVKTVISCGRENTVLFLLCRMRNMGIDHEDQPCAIDYSTCNLKLKMILILYK